MRHVHGTCILSCVWHARVQVDASSELATQQIKSVHGIVRELGAHRTPQVRIIRKRIRIRTSTCIRIRIRIGLRASMRKGHAGASWPPV